MPGGGIVLIEIVLIYFMCLVSSIPKMVGMWKTFAKAGEPGWAAIVPFFDMMIMSKIAGRAKVDGFLVAVLSVIYHGGLILCIKLAFAGRRDEDLLGLLCVISIIGISGLIAFILLLVEFSKQYDVHGVFVVGLILFPFIFWPIMGFGCTRYLGNRRRRVYDDEDEDDRPRRRRRDDDEDDEPRIRKPRRDD